MIQFIRFCAEIASRQQSTRRHYPINFQVTTIRTTLLAQVFPIINMNTMSSNKKVAFSETITTFNYPRASASDIYDMYWQEHDYRRFREEKFLDDLRAGRAQQRKTMSPLRPSMTQRRDSLTVMKNDNSSVVTKQQRGYSPAACSVRSVHRGLAQAA